MGLSSTLRLCVGILFAIIWLIDGVLLNCLQLFCYCLIRPWNVKLYRKINYYLIYSSWSQAVALAEFWANCNCKVYYKDSKSREMFSNEHALIIMNHKYEIDWLYTWIVADKRRILGNSKTFAKKSLKWVPVIGWGWKFAEMIFLERNWDKDSKTIGNSLDKIFSYDSSILLLLFAEGTRYTEDKYKASVKFANEKGLPPLKYHLQPRNRGFVYTVSHLKDKLPAIYNIQIAFSKTSKPTFTSVLKGNTLDGHVYIERIPLDNVKMDTEEDLIKLLQDMYQEKDRLMEHFEHNDSFPGEMIVYKRRLSPLLHTLFWIMFMCSLFFYIIYILIITNNFILLSSLIFTLLAAFASVIFLIRTTKAKKGSSYGKEKRKSKEITKQVEINGCVSSNGANGDKQLQFTDSKKDN